MIKKTLYLDFVKRLRIRKQRRTLKLSETLRAKHTNENIENENIKTRILKTRILKMRFSEY